jgi:hypothetical protein
MKQSSYTFGSSERSSYAIFYTVHDRLDELNLNVSLYNRSDFLKDKFDVVLNCNFPTGDIFEIAKRFQSKRTVLHIDATNEGKYMMGPMEQACNSYHELCNYKLIAQLHADVYVISDHGFRTFIKEYEENSNKDEYAFFAFPMPDRHEQYAYDFWFMVPKEENNIFKTWKDYASKNEEIFWCGESYLFRSAQSLGLKVGFLDRRPRAGMGNPPEYEPSSGIFHTHDINAIKALVK